MYVKRATFYFFMGYDAQTIFSDKKPEEMNRQSFQMYEFDLISASEIVVTIVWADWMNWI